MNLREALKAVEGGATVFRDELTARETLSPASPGYVLHSVVNADGTGGCAEIAVSYILSRAFLRWPDSGWQLKPKPMEHK